MPMYGFRSCARFQIPLRLKLSPLLTVRRWLVCGTETFNLSFSVSLTLSLSLCVFNTLHLPFLSLSFLIGSAVTTMICRCFTCRSVCVGGRKSPKGFPLHHPATESVRKQQFITVCRQFSKCFSLVDILSNLGLERKDIQFCFI